MSALGAPLAQLPRPRRPRPLTRRPTVSVVVPCYNYGHFLGQCVGSILRQEGVEVDVLIVDDASPDGSGEVAEALARDEPRVQVLRHEVNRGHIATYNDGLARVGGEYVLLLSADDMLTPGALGRAVGLMEAEPSVGLVYGKVVFYDDEELARTGRLPAVRTRQTSWSVWDGRGWIESMCRSGINHLISPEGVMRTSVLREVGLYRADLPHSGDMEMWLRAAAVAGVGRVNGADQALYRVHQASMVRTSFNTILADMRGRRDAFAAAFSEGPAARLADTTRLHDLARRRLATLALTHACWVLDCGHGGDDPIDSGRTLVAAMAMVKRAHPGVALRTAVLTSTFKHPPVRADYCLYSRTMLTFPWSFDAAG